jgi:hypothetical protein
MNCPTHPKYKAIKPPTSDCQPCRAQYDAAHPEATVRFAVPSLDAFAAQAGTEDTTRRISRLEDDLRIARGRADSAEKRQHEAERIKERVFGLTEQPVVTPKWAVERSKASGAPHIAVLLFSDPQWGEVIDVDNMDGINSYDVATAQARYRKLIERTIDISFEHLAKNKYSGIMYLRGGDMVSGDIHQELRETNELGGVEAIRSLVASETWGIQKLKEAFGNVQVISVPGNHGRTSLKPPSKKIAETNYDTLSAWWLETAFKADDAVSFTTPNSTDCVFEMHGRKYLLTHGDNIGTRGGQGFVGPIATISRGATLTLGEYARRGVHIDKMFCGHFHSAFYFGKGWSNGSLPGYSEYARSNRMTPENPQQWLINFHPRHGCTSQWLVQL